MVLEEEKEREDKNKKSAPGISTDSSWHDLPEPFRYCPYPCCRLTPAPVLPPVTPHCHQRQIRAGFTFIIRSLGHQLMSLPGEAQHLNVNPVGLGSAREAVCQTSGFYLFPPVSPGSALVHLNTDMTTFVEDHVFFFSSLNRNAMCVMFSLKRKAQGSSASGYEMIPGSIPGSKQVEYTSPRLIQQYHQCQCVSTGCWLLVIRT